MIPISDHNFEEEEKVDPKFWDDYYSRYYDNKEEE